MKKFNVDDRVKTLHGNGTIIGFEDFDDKDFPLPISDIQRGNGRIVIKLDPENQWAHKNELYYAPPKEVSLI
jgi:hypothetical protein